MKFPILLILLAAPLWAGDTFTGGHIGASDLRSQAASHFAALSGHPGIVMPMGVTSRLSLGDTGYAIIRREALADITATTRRTLSRTYGLGVTLGSSGWNPRFDCEAIAMAWALELRARLMRELWHAPRDHPVTRPAAFIFSYRVGGTGPGHARLFLATDEGPVILDPVTGPGTLTESEARTIWFPTR